MPAKLTMAYFPLRGAGDPIRMVLHHAGVEYTDFKMEFDMWPSKKAETPFGHVPVLKVDDRKFGETVAILRYLGEKYCITADSLEDKMFADSMVDAVRDVMGGILKPVYTMPEDERKVYFAEKLVEMPTLFECIEKQMSEHSTNGFLASNKLAWQDCHLLGQWNILVHFMGQEVFSKVPAIKKHYETIKSQPSIAKYFEKTKGMKVYV